MMHGYAFATRRPAPWLWLLISLSSTCLSAAPPKIEQLSVSGLQSGGATLISIQGANLTSDSQIFVPDIPLVSQQIKNATANHLELEAKVDSSAAPGIYNLRIVSPEGISNPLPIAIDGFPQFAWTDKIVSLPTALSGNVSGNQTLSTKFSAKKSQPVVLEIESQRLGSQLRPTLHVYDNQHVQLAWASTTSSLGGDVRVSFQPPADGEYTVEVHDARYAAPASSIFRLKIGTFHYANVAIPAAMQSGSKQVLRFAVSNLPTDAAAEFIAPQIPTQVAAAWPVLPMLSGFRPTITVTEEEQILESPSDSTAKNPQILPFPGGVTGRLKEAQEEDRYQLSAPAESTVRLTLSAQKIGSPMDGVLTVLDAKDGEIATADDSNRTSDPSLEFTFPKQAEAVTVVIKDVLRRGGNDYVYHLSAKLANLEDFSLSFDESQLQILPRGNALLKVQAKRTGFNGPIRLRLLGLPPGIQVADGEIPAGSDIGFCVLSSSEPTTIFGIANVIGEAESTKGTIVRRAVGPANGAATSCPWLRSDLAVAVTASPAPFSIELAGISEQLPERLPLGGRVNFPLKIHRVDGVGGDIKLSLVTTQSNTTSPANQNRQTPPNQANNNAKPQLLQLANDNPLGSNDATVDATVSVPNDLSIGDYGVVIRGDLVSSDGKNVVATYYARPRWMKAVIPFSVKLQQMCIQVRAGEGETGSLVGTIVRTDGFADPVTLSIEGLPQGILTPTFQVPAGECDFRFPVSLPFGAKSGPIKCKLTSLGKSETDKSRAGISGAPLELTLNIVPGEKPKSEKPLAIFEDEQEFVNKLSEGEGLAVLFDQDKFSENFSLLVEQKPKFRTTLPNLGIKIRENPGPGEYRYLQFAWKSVGGSGRICLQLIDDGKAQNQSGGATKYSYHSGPSPACEGQAVVVNEAPPTQWTLVTRDLFADFGEFTLTGIGAIYLDGKSALFDHIYLGRSIADFDNIQQSK